jgi:hypothetical protein
MEDMLGRPFLGAFCRAGIPPPSLVEEPMDTLAGTDYAASWMIEGTSGEQTVTEAEWFTCTDPAAMLEYLQGKASDRKPRLFAVACCRKIWHLLSDKHENGMKVVIAAEKLADGLVSRYEVAQAPFLANEVLDTDASANPSAYYAAEAVGDFYDDYVTDVARHVTDAANDVATATWNRAAERAAQTSLLRCIFGNPFRPIAISSSVLAWNDSLVVRLAQAAYEDRHLPEGTLDNGRLAILADALEEAGLTDANILGHLREPRPHVRGCWLVDLCLGKE